MSSNANLRPSARAAVVGAIYPDAKSANTYTSEWVSMQKFNTAMAIIMAGDFGILATVAAKLEQASDSSGTGAKDITGKSITTLLATASPTVDADDKTAIINVKANDLDLANGFSHVRLSLTVGVATTDVGGLMLGFDPVYGPASDDDIASVVEIV